MELRRLSLCIAVVVLAVLSQCSEAHFLQRREADTFDTTMDPMDQWQGDDGGTDGEEQNDEGADDEVRTATISSKPDNFEVQIGKNLNFECIVSDPDAVIQWIKDGKKYFMNGLAMEAPPRFSVVKGNPRDGLQYDLAIHDAQPKDRGTYRCEIVQTPPVFIEYNLEITESPTIRMSASKASLVEGNELNITCAVSGYPTPQVFWAKGLPDGNTRRLDARDGKFVGNTFTAKNVTKALSGVYYCTALNKVGNDTRTLTVTVAGRPFVHPHKTIVNSAIGIEAVLQCSVHDEALPHIKWYKGDRLIEDASGDYSIRTSGPSSTLSLTPHRDEDFGKFTCEAVNSYGTHSRSIELVEVPVVEDLRADGRNLTWVTHSHQPIEKIEVQLANEGNIVTETLPVPIKEGNVFNTVFVLPDKLQSGIYLATARVKNSKGWSRKSDEVLFDFGNGKHAVEESAAQSIVTASVLGKGSNACSIRPTTAAVLSTTLMYLLVRTL